MEYRCECIVKRSGVQERQRRASADALAVHLSYVRRRVAEFKALSPDVFATHVAALPNPCSQFQRCQELRVQPAHASPAAEPNPLLARLDELLEKQNEMMHGQRQLQREVAKLRRKRHRDRLLVVNTLVLQRITLHDPEVARRVPKLLPKGDASLDFAADAELRQLVAQVERRDAHEEVVPTEFFQAFWRVCDPFAIPVSSNSAFAFALRGDDSDIQFDGGDGFLFGHASRSMQLAPNTRIARALHLGHEGQWPISVQNAFNRALHAAYHGDKHPRVPYSLVCEAAAPNRSHDFLSASCFFPSFSSASSATEASDDGEEGRRGKWLCTRARDDEPFPFGLRIVPFDQHWTQKASEDNFRAALARLVPLSCVFETSEYVRYRVQDRVAQCGGPMSSADLASLASCVAVGAATIVLRKIDALNRTNFRVLTKCDQGKMHLDNGERVWSAALRCLTEVHGIDTSNRELTAKPPRAFLESLNCVRYRVESLPDPPVG